MKTMFFLSFIVFICCYSCGKLNFPEKFYRIQLDNHSDDTIWVYIALETAFEYPDTSIETTRPATGFRDVAPKRSTYFDSRQKWEEVFDKSLPGKRLSMYIFNADTLAHYDWETIRSGYKVLRRYDLSIEDLQKLDFKVPYPPTAEMTGMKMYPLGP